MAGSTHSVGLAVAAINAVVSVRLVKWVAVFALCNVLAPAKSFELEPTLSTTSSDYLASFVVAPVNVVGCEFVPLGAMRLFGVANAYTIASHGIFSGCDNFQMCGVAAASIAAKVIDGQPIRNGATQQLPRETVNTQVPASYRDLPVAIFGFASLPLPAISRCCSNVSVELLDNVDVRMFSGHVATLLQSWTRRQVI